MNTVNEVEPGLIEGTEQAGLSVMRPAPSLVPAKIESSAPLTPQQARAVEVNEALQPAYQRASTLEMTDAEVQALMAPFPDTAVEIRPHDGLIYIPHIHVSNRLNQVFKPGKWSLICRRHWIEGTVMYGEYILLIRGCYVGESVGGHPYQPNNPKVNYSDTLESTAAEALRRICGKRLGCGSQVWEPAYARAWVAKYAQQVGGKWSVKPTNIAPMPKPAPAPTPAPAPLPAPKPTPPSNKSSADVSESPEQRKARWLKLCLDAGGGKPDYATEFFFEAGWILDTEDFTAISDSVIPKTKADAQKILNEIRRKAGTFNPPPEDQPAKPTGGAENVEEYDKPDAAWRSVIVPFGKMAGKTLGEVEKPFLFGLWANFKVQETWIGKDGNPRKTKPEKIAQDRAFREALDSSGLHYEFTKPDDSEIVP